MRTRSRRCWSTSTDCACSRRTHRATDSRAALPPESYRPSILAGVAADLSVRARDLPGSLRRASPGAGASAARSARGSLSGRRAWRSSTVATSSGRMCGTDLTADLDHASPSRATGIEEDSFESWDAYFAFEREALDGGLRLAEAAHRATMREAEGRVVPILEPEALGAIKHGGRREPVTDDVSAGRRGRRPGAAADGSRRARSIRQQPRLRRPFPLSASRAHVESRPDGIHDLVSYDPAGWPTSSASSSSDSAAGQPPP